MRLLGFIFALSMTSQITPSFGKYYVLRDEDGGAYFFDESDLRSQDPTKSYYYMTTDDYKGAGELVTNIQKKDEYSSYAEGKDYESSEDADQAASMDQTEADLYGILNKLNALKGLALNKAPKKSKYKLIPGDFQTRSYHHPVGSVANNIDNKSDDTFMGLPTSHLSAIMQLLDDVALDREESPRVERMTPKINAPHVELNTGIPKTEPTMGSADDIVKKLKALIESQKKT